MRFTVLPLLVVLATCCASACATGGGHDAGGSGGDGDAWIGPVDASVADPWDDAGVADDVDEPPRESDFEVVIGAYEKPSYDFVVMDDGSPAEIVQGPQGGIHLSTALELSPGVAWASESTVFIDIVMTTWIDDEVVGVLELDHFAAGAIAPGVFRTAVLPVVFDENIAAPYVGFDAVVIAEVTLDDAWGTGDCPVLLVDEE